MAAFRPSARSTTYRSTNSGSFDQLPGGPAVIALQPQAAAHALEASARAAQALRAVRPDRQVPDLAAIGIRSAPHAPIFVDAAADAGRKSHVEERRVALARPEFGFADRARVGVVIHDRGGAGQIPHESAEVEIPPSAHVRREHDALGRKIHRAAEADPAAVEAELAAPGRDDLADAARASIRARPRHRWRAIPAAPCGRRRRPPC